MKKLLKIDVCGSREQYVHYLQEKSTFTTKKKKKNTKRKRKKHGIQTTPKCVRLNLFNYVLVLFHAKFACNLTIRNPVFR